MAKEKYLYSVLGVSKTASQDDIQKAYRRLAKESHPDLHPGDRAAEDKFKSVSAAYDILGDEEKRKRYDRGEIDATGAETHPGGFYRQQADANTTRQYYTSAGFEDMADLDDVFAELFGHREAQTSRAQREATFAMRGSDIRRTTH